jgi:hypothetical protein
MTSGREKFYYDEKQKIVHALLVVVTVWYGKVERGTKTKRVARMTDVRVLENRAGPK